MESHISKVDSIVLVEPIVIFNSSTSRLVFPLFRMVWKIFWLEKLDSRMRFELL